MTRRARDRRLLSLALLAAALSLVLGWLSTASVPAAPSPAAGCTACHAPGKAATLDASLKKIPNHPQLPTATLAMCVACHKADGKAAPLGRVMHRRHLIAKSFTATYKGTCTSCHAVDAKTGAVTVIGLPPR